MNRRTWWPAAAGAIPPKVPRRRPNGDVASSVIDAALGVAIAALFIGSVEALERLLR